MEMEKHVFGKQMFAGPGRDNGIQSGLRDLGPVSPNTPSPYSLEIYLMIVLLWEQQSYPKTLGN